MVNETKQTVHVVMGNDYPDAVFTTREAGDSYCKQRREEDKHSERRIYWRCYEFELQE